MSKTVGAIIGPLLAAGVWTAGCGGDSSSDLFQDGNGGTAPDAGAGGLSNQGGAVAVGTGGTAGTVAGGAAGIGGLPAGGAPVGGQTGAGGRMGPTDGSLGALCERDGDCGAGLFCLAEGGSDFVGGGPSGGLCVADCSVDGPAGCTSLAPGSRCVLVDDGGTVATGDDVAYCFPGCSIGGGTATTCLGRPDLTCFESSVSPTQGFCQPACNGDFECGGRACDFALGVCVDPATTEGLLPIGAECDPASTTRACDGICLQFTDTFAACSGFCRLGELGCGSDPASPDPFAAVCALSVGDPDLYSVGDAGFCLELCDCNDQCGHPGAVCDPFDPELVRSLGRGGLCVPAEFAVVPEGTPCGS